MQIVQRLGTGAGSKEMLRVLSLCRIECALSARGIQMHTVQELQHTDTHRYTQIHTVYTCASCWKIESFVSFQPKHRTVDMCRVLHGHTGPNWNAQGGKVLDL